MRRETIFVVAAVLTSVSCGADAPSATESEDASSLGPGLSMRDASGFEVMWMTQMIDHHAMAVDMGEVCLDKAEHDELLDLCGDVVETQTREIELMQTWLRAWYGVDYTAGENGMMMMMMMGDGDLSRLTGGAFEVAFLEEMIPHHQQAVHMSEACLAQATSEPLKKLCASIIQTQSVEIASMQTWLCEWYEICDARGAMGGGGTGPYPMDGTGSGAGPGPMAGGGMGGGGMGPGPMSGGMGGHR